MVPAVSVHVHAGKSAAQASKKVVHRRAKPLAFDVPQRFVDTRQCIVEHRPAAPVGAHIRCLPDVLDVVDTAPNQERPQVVLDCRDDSQRSLREGRTTDAVEAVVCRLHLHDYQSNTARSGADGAHVRDAHVFTAGVWLRRYDRGWRRVTRLVLRHEIFFSHSANCRLCKLLRPRVYPQKPAAQRGEGCRRGPLFLDLAPVPVK